MKLVIIFGPQAAGKMTVGQKLTEITDLKLFHNHMSIDAVNSIFSYGTEIGKKLVKNIRQMIFEEVIKSDLEGIIFTWVWAFDLAKDNEYIAELESLFENNKGDVYFVELETDFEVRIERNKTENRLAHKPTKHDVAFSEKDLRLGHKIHTLNSKPGQFKSKKYIRINNTEKTPEKVAVEIKNAFNL